MELSGIESSDDESSHVESSRVVRATIAPLLTEPRASASLSSQLLRGEPVTVLEVRGHWVRVHGEDRYEGWMHEGYLAAPNSGDDFSCLSLGCDVLEGDGAKRSLPFGARLTSASTIVEGRAVALSELGAEFPRHASAICDSALTLFEGASYLWGGSTPWGCDCSGYVQRVFRLHGVSLPRDAWQQFRCGEAVELDRDVIQQGDLLFFSDRDDGRITHVGLAVDELRMIHSSLARGGVAVDAVVAAGLAAQFRGARRVV